MSSKLSLTKIEQAIQLASPEEQKRLLHDLPSLLKLASSDLAWLKIAEGSFDFWDNEDDVMYDQL